MDSKLLLVKSVCLLYRESQQIIKTESSVDFVRTGVENIKESNDIVGMGTMASPITALKATVIEMCNNPVDHEYDKDTLLQTLKMNCGHDDKLYDILEEGIHTEYDSSQLKRSITNLRKSLSDYFRQEKLQDILSKAAWVFKNKRDTIKDIGKFIIDHMAECEPFQLSTKGKDPAILESIDINDEDSLTKAFGDLEDKGNESAIFKTGWQGLNRMLQGGFRRGEFWAGEALQHQWKTGFSLAIFTHLALYNTPYMIDQTKKPLLLRYTMEDAGYDNIKFIYNYLHLQAGTDVEDVPKIIDSIPEISKVEMAKFVKEKLSVNGYNIKIKRVDPTNWSYLHLINDMLELEAEGYEIHHLSIDYLNVLPKTGCTVGPMGSDIRDLFRRVRNFTVPRKIFTYTPHQLSTEAKNLAREGRQNLVKQIAGLGYTDGCKTIDNELDGELLFHKEFSNKRAYLTMQRSKHRGVEEIPEHLKFCCWMWPKRGPIPADIGFKDTSLSKVGGTSPNTVEDDTFSSSAFI